LDSGSYGRCRRLLLKKQKPFIKNIATSNACALPGDTGFLISLY
jgi:hypothetical protein